ncbi:MAG: TetR/AcrR family transcriptional regulator [Bacteroidota bacterium]|nr:TetR/AcrR family transcriptional regulator [Bacteroidota bacterium]
MSNTRDYIIDQAYSLFLSHSYEAVSISEISKAIGFTKGALYHHFKNKEELFMAVIDKYLIIEELDINADEITLKEFLDLNIKKAQEIINKSYSSNPAYIPLNLLSLFIDAFRHYPEFANKKQDLIHSEINKTKRILDLAVKNGEIKKDLNTSAFAEIIFTLNTGVARNLIHNIMDSETAIKIMRKQFHELYKLIKT